jgi:hypothetical protein
MEARQYARLETVEGLETGVWYVYVDCTLDEDRPFYGGKGSVKNANVTFTGSELLTSTDGVVKSLW